MLRHQSIQSLTGPCATLYGRPTKEITHWRDSPDQVQHGIHCADFSAFACPVDFTHCLTDTGLDAHNQHDTYSQGQKSNRIKTFQGSWYPGAALREPGDMVVKAIL